MRDMSATSQTLSTVVIGLFTLIATALAMYWIARGRR